MHKQTLAILMIIGLNTFCYSQKIVIDEPKKLNDTINSNAEDIYPILSPDGGTLYFVRAFHAENTGGEMAGQDIWYSKRDEAGAWQLPRNLTELNTVDNNIVVGISAQEDTLYLLNTYSGPLRNNRGVAFSVRKGDMDWSDPEELNLRFRNNSPFKGYYVTPDGQTIIVSAEGVNSYGEEDLYMYVKEKGRWNGPIHLSDSINTSGFEISPFLTEDKKMLFFASNGHGGRGDADIFMTTRLDDSWTRWSKPVNLGSAVNSAAFDAYFSVHSSGEAFFASNRNEKFAEIYTVNVTFEADTIEADTIPSPEEPEPVAAVVDTIPVEKVVVETFYTVQILALKKREAPEEDFFTGLDQDQITMYVGKDGFNRFSIGQHDSPSLAVAEMKKLRKSGYSDAFVRKVERYSELSVREGENIVSYYQAKQKENPASPVLSEKIETDSDRSFERSESTLAVADTIPKETIVEKTYYTVQVLALRKREAPEKDFFNHLDLNMITMYVGEDGFNRFSSGQYDTFSSAMAEMKKLRALGYPDAFIRKVDAYTELSIRQGESIINYYKAKEKEKENKELPIFRTND